MDGIDFFGIVGAISAVVWVCKSMFTQARANRSEVKWSRSSRSSRYEYEDGDDDFIDDDSYELRERERELAAELKQVRQKLKG